MKMRTPATVAALVALAGLAPQRADANVVAAQWASSTSFNYQVIYVPDFDQRRNTLPSTGSNYCVPSSFMNWAAYIARRGHPSQPPGPPAWDYNNITINLILLGVLQGTDPDGGTGPSGGASGGGAWLSGRALVLATTGNTSAGFPRLSTLANQAINSGALIIPRVGWYDISNFPIIVRNGGHAVSMVKAQRSGSSQLIGIHDPAWTPNGDTFNTQSNFTRNEYVVQDIQVVPLGNGLPVATTMSRLNGYGSSTTHGYIYGNYTILPYVVLTPVTNGISLRLLRINFANPGMPESETIANPQGRRIRRGMYGMTANEIFYAADELAGPGCSLFLHDLADDSHTPLASPTDPFHDMTTSRFDRVYMLAGRTVYCVNPNNPGGDYIEASMTVDPDIKAMAFDDSTDEIVMLDARSRQIHRYRHDLPAGVPPIIQQLPTNVPAGPTGGIDVRPGDGSVLIATQASTTAALLLPAIQAGDEEFDVEFISIPFNDQPLTGGSFTDMGVMLVAGGVGYEMMKDPDTGRWVLVEDSPFTGLEMDGPMFSARSRTDVDRATEMNPENADTLPDDFSGNTGFIACPADVNGDGLVNFTDLNAVLTSFGETGVGLPGDTNGDGVVDFTDLNNVLTNFGEDCG